MGSPLGPVLANIFMCDFEEEWIINNPRFHPTLWYRYVDDTFSMFDSKDTANEFLKYLNGRHNSIKFTIELAERYIENNVYRLPRVPLASLAESRHSDSHFARRMFFRPWWEPVHRLSFTIANHIKTTGHNIKWDHFDILASGKTDYHCKIKETLFIQELQPALNANVSSEKLLLFLGNLFIVPLQTVSVWKRLKFLLQMFSV